MKRKIFTIFFIIALIVFIVKINKGKKIVINGKRKYSILFDLTKCENCGNGDWKIDDDYPYPLPRNPEKESDWNGALSTIAFTLFKSGNFKFITLTPDKKIHYGGGDIFDLKNFDLLFICEPNIKFSMDEKISILKYLRNGGALFGVSDHFHSDRNGDGVDSVDVWNDLFSENPYRKNPFGFYLNYENVSGIFYKVSSKENFCVKKITEGIFGKAYKIRFHRGTTLSIVRGNSTGIFSRKDIYPNFTVAASHFGKGRIFFICDSSPLDDGTGEMGKKLYRDIEELDNKRLILNGIMWLLKIKN